MYPAPSNWPMKLTSAYQQREYVLDYLDTPASYLHAYFKDHKADNGCPKEAVINHTLAQRTKEKLN